MASTSVVWDRSAGVRVEGREVPSPGPGELRIGIEASGLCGTDIHIASGEYPFARPNVTLGHEFVGAIVETGPGVESFGVGERIVADPNVPCRTCTYCHSARPHLCENPQALGVTLNGGLAESAIVPLAQAYRVPENLPSEAAALTEPLACALHAVDLGKMRPGETALVLGAGPIGVLCASLLLESGASSVLVSEPSPERRDRIRELGVETILPEDLTEGTADVVFECVGRAETMEAAVNAARPGGTIMWVGVAAPETTVEIRPYDIFRLELTIRGPYTNPYAMERSLALLDSGRIDWEKIVTHRFPLSDFHEAWNVHRRGEGLKVCIYPTAS